MFEAILVVVIMLILPELIYLKFKSKLKKNILNMDDKTPVPTVVNNPGTHTFKYSIEEWNKNLDKWARIKNASNTSNLQ